MAVNENQVPEAVRDILAYMPQEMRLRVLTNYEVYAPFLSMLAGWKTAIQQHYAFGEDSAIARLEEQFFPLGEWRFPVQTLAVPSRTPERAVIIDPTAEMRDAAGRPWLPCGGGWALPTELRAANLELFNRADWFITLDIDYIGEGRFEDILSPREGAQDQPNGQLAFVAASEEFVAAISQAEWWYVGTDRRPQPARLTRYRRYMNFERELQTARLNQRHLDLWLPACYPYSRKHVLFQLRAESKSEPPNLNWMDPVRSGGRLVGILRRPVGKNVAAMNAQAQRMQRSREPLFYLNAVPVVQTAMQFAIKYPAFPTAGNEYVLRIAGQPDVYAAVVYADDMPIPASMYRQPSATNLEKDVVAQFPRVDAEQAQRATIKIYFGSFGERGPDGETSPGSLTLTPLRFEAPFRPLGGLTIGSPEGREEWARQAWYHSVFRPPLLAEGDLIEIFRQRKNPLGDFLRFRYATREIQHHPDERGAHWRSYLWPTILPNMDSLNDRKREIPADNYTPLAQCLRLAFERGPQAAGVPEFLLTDVANYLASILSQYFVLSAFQVEGRLV